MVPKRLKDARLAAGLSQEKLAELADIDAVNSRAQISGYETGRHTPPYNFVVRLAKALDYPEAYFYVLDDVFAEMLLQLYKNRENPEFNPYLVELEEARLLLNEAYKTSSSLTQRLKSGAKKNKI